MTAETEPKWTHSDFAKDQEVSCVVLEEKTKKGGWRFQIVDSDVVGNLHPTSSEPPDLAPGQALRLIIAATGTTFMFKWDDHA